MRGFPDQCWKGKRRWLNGGHPAALVWAAVQYGMQKILRDRFSGIDRLYGVGSAERLAEFLKARWLPAPDAIISGIPFSTMPAEVSDRVASSVARVLRPGGRFVAYQVRAHVSGFVSPYLGKPEKKWEVVNVPPVRVFTWVKPEA